MNSEKEIVELIDDKEIVKRFYAIKNVEEGFASSNMEAYKNLVFLAENIKNLYALSDQEELESDKLKNNLVFNYFKYSLYKAFYLTEEDTDLEKIFKLLYQYNKFYKCELSNIRKLLKNGVSDPYLLLYLLLNIIYILLKYYNNQLLMFESSSKGVWTYTDQDDI